MLTAHLPEGRIYLSDVFIFKTGHSMIKVDYTVMTPLSLAFDPGGFVFTKQLVGVVIKLRVVNNRREL